MNLNPFTIRYGYHAARRLAQVNHNAAAARLKHLSPLGDKSSRQQLPFEVVCMLCKAAVPEAVVALRSFLTHAGRPRALTLVSDGSLSDVDKATLKHSISSAVVRELDELRRLDLPKSITDRTNDHWMIRKQALLMSLPLDHPTLFLDSDVVFFPGASALMGDLADLGSRPAFMADVEPSFDPSLLRKSDPLTPPLNSGFLYIPRSLDWTEAVDRFAALPPEATLAFTDQTMSHLTFHAESARALDPNRYILENDDQFYFKDKYAHNFGVVCRHYVGPIRHKLWMLKL